MSKQEFNKAQRRLAKMVGASVRVILADGKETEGILDSFYFENPYFIVLDDSYKIKIINFAYVYMIYPIIEGE